MACGVSVLQWATGAVGATSLDPVPRANATAPFPPPVAAISPVPAELPSGARGARSRAALDPDRPVPDRRRRESDVRTRRGAGNPCGAAGRGSDTPPVEDPRRTLGGGDDRVQLQEG